MQRDPRFEALFNRLQQNPRGPVGLLQKIATIAAAVVAFGLALTFSVVFFAVVVAAGGLIWGYVWWKTRALRKAMREARAQAGGSAPHDRAPADGIVIEGEVVREIREAHHEGPRD